MPITHLIEQIIRFTDQQSVNGTFYPTTIKGLSILFSRSPTAIEPLIYAPLVCLILQGRKETSAGNQSIGFSAGESLIVSHELPVLSRITKASKNIPYIAMALELDLSIVRSLHDEISDTDLNSDHRSAMNVGQTSGKLLNAMEKLFSLAHHPVEGKVLIPLVLREIHFWLLFAHHGEMLRQLLRRGSHADRIAKAIALIKTDLGANFTVSDLAKTSGMGVSSFHQHFKTVTGMTPLQYQKDLRLLQARVMLQDGNHNVASTAYDCGYESPTQFSREYSRKFGVTPREDLFSVMPD